MPQGYQEREWSPPFQVSRPGTQQEDNALTPDVGRHVELFVKALLAPYTTRGYDMLYTKNRIPWPRLTGAARALNTPVRQSRNIEECDA